jgi:hypothetical protein
VAEYQHNQDQLEEVLSKLLHLRSSLQELLVGPKSKLAIPSGAAVTMNPAAARRGMSLVSLHEEMGSIHFENELYLDQGLAHVRKEVAEDERRVGRCRLERTERTDQLRCLRAEEYVHLAE